MVFIRITLTYQQFQGGNVTTEPRKLVGFISAACNSIIAEKGIIVLPMVSLR